MSWANWAGYLAELTTLSLGVAIAIYAWKVLAPRRIHDRLAVIALTLATLGSGAALCGGALTGGSPVWALFACPVLGVFWLLEGEFGTRILGLIAGLAGFGAQVVFPFKEAVLWGSPLWQSLTQVGAVLMGSFLVFALGTWLLALLYRHSSSIGSRKTARFFVINLPIIAELAYRLNALALPFAGFVALAGVFGMLARQVSLVTCAALWLSGACSGAYALGMRKGATDGSLWGTICLMTSVLALFGALKALGFLGVS